MPTRVAGVTSLLLALGRISTSTAANSTCKCTFGNDCWPTADEFSVLQSNLSHPLIYPVAPESACYTSAGTADPACVELKEQYNNGTWRADQAGAMETPFWERYVFSNGTVEACYLNTTLGSPCLQGSVPPVGVDAYNTADIQNAVKFAATHNLKLVIKNTGHDTSGRSIARGAFMIWTHHFKGTEFDEQTNQLKLAAGVQWSEAYAAAENHDRYIAGGLSNGGSVGAAGGWILGGGHSLFSPKFGLGVDNVVAFESVDASGNLLKASQEENTDLFWALRGGGGGTFGVVTSVTYQTHPIVSVIGAFILANISSTDVKKAVFSKLLPLELEWNAANIGGASGSSETTVNAFFVAPNYTLADAQTLFQPFLDYLETQAPDAVQSGILEFDSPYDWIRAILETDLGASLREGIADGKNIQDVTRLLEKDNVSADPDAVAEFLASNPGAQVHLVGGGVVSSVDPDSMALNPSWRSSIGQTGLGIEFPEGATGSEIESGKSTLAEVGKQLDQIAGPHAYLNEAFRYEENFQEVFFGDHYEKLSSIKTKYDPKDLFIVQTGVGSERWDSDQVCPL